MSRTLGDNVLHCGGNIATFVGLRIIIVISDLMTATCLLIFFSGKEWSDCSSTSKNAQSSAGVEEGRGDSPENQNHVTRPTEQVEGVKEIHSIVCV